jgi:hypothetical protein
MSSKLFLILALLGSLLAFGGGFGGVHVYLTKEYEAAVDAFYCSKNLRIIDQAVSAYASEKGLPPGSTLGWGNLDAYLSNRPSCPSEGKYNVSSVGTPVTCSIESHTPDAERLLRDNYPVRAADVH